MRASSSPRVEIGTSQHGPDASPCVVVFHERCGGGEGVRIRQHVLEMAVIGKRI